MRKIVAGASLIACCMPGAALAATAGRRAPAPIDFRLHAAVPAAGSRPAIASRLARFRPAAGGSLVQLYPFAGSSLHLTAGNRMFARAARALPSELDTARLIAGPRAGRRGLRSGPAALVGIGRDIAKGLAVGIDGGATLGRLDRAPNRLGGGQSERGDREGGLNKIARVTALYHF